MGGAGIDRFVPFAEGGAAFTDEGHGHPATPFAGHGKGHAGDVQGGNGERRGRRQNAAVEIADMQVTAPHGRQILGHLGGEHPPHHVGIRAHGEGGAEVADHRCDHVALPAAVVAAPHLAPPQPQRRGIDRLLAEGAESFALEGTVAPAHVRAEEKLLEAVVDRAGDDHAGEHLAAFVDGDRRGDGLAAEKTVGIVDQLLEGLVQPGPCWHSGGGFERIGHFDLFQPGKQAAPEKGAHHLDFGFERGCLVAVRQTVLQGLVEGLLGSQEAERVFFGQEGREAAAQLTPTGGLGHFHH